MKISFSWLLEWIPLQQTAQEVAAELSVKGLEVEQLEVWKNYHNSLTDFVVGEVVECRQHPNADKLKLTQVNIGTAENLQIVCGAANVAQGQKVAVAKMGAWIHLKGKEPFQIKEAKLRGELSQGMICAEDELGLGTSHEGILVLPKDTPIGISLATLFPQVEDTILEIGLTANRGDAASHLGVARDCAAIFNTKLENNKEQLQKWSEPFQGLPSVKIAIEDKNECRRYVAIKMENVKVQPSPSKLANRLRSIGIEPKNNIVDITNYVLHHFGQPIHAFDANEISGNSIFVRKANLGETILTLDGKMIELTNTDLLIADGQKPLALAGVMGGKNSGVKDETTSVLIESAWFNPISVRKSARLHGFSTDASFRFERGTDIEICGQAAWFAAKLIEEYAEGKITEFSDNYEQPWNAKEIELSYAEIDKAVGSRIEVPKIQTILTNLGFTLKSVSNIGFTVVVPSYRNDCSIPADLIEEIVRIYGLDNVPMPLQMKTSMNTFVGFKNRNKIQQIKNRLVNMGWLEVQNNSLTSKSYYDDKVLTQAVELTNPLSADMAVMRLSLIPGVLENIAYNKNRRNEDLHLFEVGKVYENHNGRIAEKWKLVLAMCGNGQPESWEKNAVPATYFDVKRVLLSLGLDEKTAQTAVRKISAREQKQYGIKNEVWLAEIGLEWSMQKTHSLKVIDPPKFPWMRRDLSLVLDKSITYEKINSTIQSNQTPLVQNSFVFDIYEGKPLAENQKAVALGFELGYWDKTAKDEEADEAMNKLVQAFETELSATIRK